MQLIKSADYLSVFFVVTYILFSICYKCYSFFSGISIFCPQRRGARRNVLLFSQATIFCMGIKFRVFKFRRSLFRNFSTIAKNAKLSTNNTYHLYHFSRIVFTPENFLLLFLFHKKN